LSAPPLWAARVCAALIGTAAWVGLAVDFAASLSRTGSVALSLWAMLRFFTITTNLLVALTFTAIALGGARQIGPRALAGLSLSIMLVGIVFKLLLARLSPPGFALGNFLLHTVAPIAVPAYWLGFVPKGRLRIADPFVWTLYPLAYLAYALLRGQFDGRYPYPFLDVAEIGWSRMAINALAIGASFLVTGLFAVWIDRILSRLPATASA
jgi:hypothetical protein